jgi:hypothetical protein
MLSSPLVMAHNDVEKGSLHKTPSAEIASVSDDHVFANGVKAVEATHKVYGKYSRWFLFIGYVAQDTTW